MRDPDRVQLERREISRWTEIRRLRRLVNSENEHENRSWSVERGQLRGRRVVREGEGKGGHNSQK